MTEFLQAAETALKEEVDDIVRAIPCEDLAIQWDVCEPSLRRRSCAVLEMRPSMYAAPQEARPCAASGLAEQHRAMAKAVPDGVTASAFTCCYGSAEDRHALEPVDTGLLGEFMNRASERVARRIDGRTSRSRSSATMAAYFAPPATFDSARDPRLRRCAAQRGRSGRRSAPNRGGKTLRRRCQRRDGRGARAGMRTRESSRDARPASRSRKLSVGQRRGRRRC